MQRLCIDYRALNMITEKDKYSIPLIHEIVDEMVGLQLFSKIDSTQGYYQICVHPEHVCRTSIQKQLGSYHLKVAVWFVQRTDYFSTYH